MQHYSFLQFNQLERGVFVMYMRKGMTLQLLFCVATPFFNWAAYDFLAVQHIFYNWPFYNSLMKHWIQSLGMCEQMYRDPVSVETNTVLQLSIEKKGISISSFLSDYQRLLPKYMLLCW